MKTLNESQIQKLVEDIATIKDVLARSKPTLQMIFLPRHFRLMSMVLGISILVIAGVYYWLILVFGSHSDIPDIYRYAVYSAIIIDWIALGIMKLRNWTRSISSMDPDYTFGRTIREFITFKTVHSYILFFLTVSFFTVYWIITGHFYMIIPTLSIGFGLIFNFIGNMTEIAEYITCGSWMLLWGFIIIVSGTIPGPIAIILSFGIGMLIFSLHSYIGGRMRGE